MPILWKWNLIGESLRILDAVPWLDPPEHITITAVAFDWFRPANPEKWEGQIRANAKESVERLIAGPRELDAVKEFAVFIPLRVIMTLFGVAEEDEPRMFHADPGRTADTPADFMQLLAAHPAVLERVENDLGLASRSWSTRRCG